MAIEVNLPIQTTFKRSELHALCATRQLFVVNENILAKKVVIPNVHSSTALRERGVVPSQSDIIRPPPNDVLIRVPHKKTI